MGLFRYKALKSGTGADGGRQPLRLEQKPTAAAIQELGKLLKQEWSQRHQRTDELRQLEPTECAAICLAIVLRHYGLHRPLSELRHACGISRDGSNAAQLVLAARQYGLEARGFKQGIRALRDIETPAVLFWEFNHFVVVEAFDDAGAWINNPASGRSHLSADDLDKAYTGIVLTLKPGAAFAPGGHEPSRVKALWRQLNLSRLSLRVSFLLSLGSTAALLLLLLVEGNTINSWMILLVLAAAGLAPIVHALARQIEHRSGTRLQRRLLSMPDWALQQHLLRELSGRHQGVRRVSDFIGRDLLISLPLLFLLLLGGAIASHQNPLAGIVLLLGMGTVLAMLLFEERLQHPLENEATRLERLQQHQLNHDMQDPRTLKSLCLEQSVLQRWSGLHAHSTQERQHQRRQQHLTAWLPELLTWAVPILLISLHPGETQVVLIALAWLWILDRIRGVQKQWLRISEPLDRIQAVQAEPRDPLLMHALGSADQKSADEKSAAEESPERNAATLDTRALHYGHVPGRSDLINGLNLHIASGEWLAITGRSGSGKSTLLQLMAGLKQPEAGSVLLNGKPLLHWSRNQRCRTMAMVSQDDALLPISVRDNLTLWNREINDQTIEAVCQALGIGTAIQQLPDGLDTELGDGGMNLSGGQRQLLNLARALLQNPRLLLLDEATSALDTRSEACVLEHLRTLNCTVVMVAHRSGSLRMADRVININQMQTNLTDPTP